MALYGPIVNAVVTGATGSTVARKSELSHQLASGTITQQDYDKTLAHLEATNKNTIFIDHPFSPFFWLETGTCIACSNEECPDNHICCPVLLFLILASGSEYLATGNIVDQLAYSPNAWVTRCLALAAEFGFFNVCKSIFQFVESDQPAALGNALCHAHETDNMLPIARWLIKNGADVNFSGGLALCTAAETGNKLLVGLLVDNGARVNLGNAICLAQKNGHDEIVALLQPAEKN